MDALFESLLPQAGKCAILVAFGAALIALVLRKGPGGGACWVRLACVAVLLQGWMLFPAQVTLAWLEPVAVSEIAPAEARPLDPHVPKTSPAASHAMTWSPSLFLGSLWLAGMIVIAAAMVLSHRRMTRVLSGARRASAALCGEWRRVTGHRANSVRVLTGSTRSPVLCRLRGSWSLVLPQDFERTLDEHERRTVFRHEFAHFQRHDCVKSLLVTLLVLPQWFNPAAWRLARWFREAAEWSCDDHAAPGVDERLCLAKILHRLSAHARAPLPCGMMGVAEQPIVARVRRLLAPRPGISRALASCLSALLLASVAVSATQIRLVPAQHGLENIGSGVTTGVLRDNRDGKLTLVDATGRTWAFAYPRPYLQTYLQGETYTVHWRHGELGPVAHRVSGEGTFVGTVIGFREAGIDIQPIGGGPAQHIRPHWDGPTQDNPRGSLNGDDQKVISATSPGDLVRVRWEAEEWKRVVELERVVLP